MSHAPVYLKQTAVTKQLVVDGKPFLIRGAELQNSSLSSPEYMETCWQNLKDMHINTILGSVAWEDIEPVEGQFNFEKLDQVIDGARRHGLKLILLWFGSFKNGVSTYIPSWVKTDSRRFPRAKLRQPGDKLDVSDALSLFYNTAEADAKAFTQLMRHLKEVEANKPTTVIMVQVENETGLLYDSRDRCAAAEKAFNSPVPEEFVSFLKENWDDLHHDLKRNFPNFLKACDKNTSWPAVFGHGLGTDEIFMAYHLSRYVNQVAAAGKKEYPLPFFTNVWMNYMSDDSDNAFPTVAGGGGYPGDYPSGGAVTNVIDVWHHYATNLDFIAPDLYLNDYESTCRNYRYHNQPLLIPEQRRDEYGARRIWVAYGSYQALGVSPFGIDTLEAATCPFTRQYGLLESVNALVLDAQATKGKSVGFFFDEIKEDGTDPNPPFTHTFEGSDVQLIIERSFVFGKPGPGCGMVIHQGGNKFICIGWGFQVRAKGTSPDCVYTSILNFEEKEVVNVETGELRTLRRLNGDETRSGLMAIMPNEDPDYGGFPICVTIPSRTMIAELEFYTLNKENVEN